MAKWVIPVAVGGVVLAGVGAYFALRTPTPKDAPAPLPGAEQVRILQQLRASGVFS